MRHALSLLAVATFSLALISCDQTTVDVPVDPDPLAWNTITEFGEPTSPTTVWGSGPDDVYIGYLDNSDGSRVLRHFDGSTWKFIHLMDRARWVSNIWGSGPDDVYAIANEQLWHFDGAVWTTTEIMASRVEGTGGDNVIAGNSRYLFHFDGAAWDTLLTSPADNTYLNSFWVGDGPTALVYLENYPESDSLMRFSGGAWSPPEPVPSQYMTDFWGTDLDDIIAVGRGGVGGMAWHWNGSSWTELMNPEGRQNLYNLFEIGTGLYAAGCDLYEYNGASFEPVTVPGIDDCFDDGWASDGLNVYLTGRSVSHYAGSGWALEFPLTPERPHALWAYSRDHLAMAGYNEVYRYANGVWTEEGEDTIQGGIDAIAGNAWDDLYASTSQGVYHSDGVAWTLMPDSPGNIRVMAVAPSGELIGGTGGEVYRLDDSGWQQIWAYQNGSYYGQNAIWAFSGNHVLVADDHGILSFNGASWERIFDGDDCNDLWASSEEDVYAVAYGHVLHQEGDRFERVGPTIPGDFRSIAGTSDGHVIAVGRNGYAAFYQGKWVAGINQAGHITLDVVPAKDGSIVRFDGLSGDTFRLTYHTE